MFPTAAAWSNAECSTEDFGKVTGIVVTNRRGNVADCKIRIAQEVVRTLHAALLDVPMRCFAGRYFERPRKMELAQSPDGGKPLQC